MNDGIVRTFYKSLKSATGSVIKRIFITGVSPMMVNDLTSGFNMATDLSLRPKYNEMFGFTNDEVEWLIKETGTDKSQININIEHYYNGYKFYNGTEVKVFNPQVVLYLLYQTLEYGKQPSEIVDPNIKTGYTQLHHLALNENNREKLFNIVRNGWIANRDDIKFVAIVFRGKGDYEMRDFT